MPVSASSTESFQFQRANGGCSCPIHRNRDREPTTVPLGFSFAEHVDAAPISRESAADIYHAHHSYMDDIPEVNLQHHGLYFQGNLVGAVTYRMPLGTRKLHFDEDGQLLSRPHSRDDLQELPAELRPTAREILPFVDESEVAETSVVGGRTIAEVGRICIGVDMPNLASAALARSQERFSNGPHSEDVEYLLTFVRADFSASMIRALRDKGWLCTGWSEPSQAGNRQQLDVRDRYKWRFLCPIARIHDQSRLSQWSGSR
jgi:hypothetical protein